MTQFPVSTSNEQSIHAALELSKNSWLLAIQVPGRDNPSLYPIRGGIPLVVYSVPTGLAVRKPLVFRIPHVGKPHRPKVGSGSEAVIYDVPEMVRSVG